MTTLIENDINKMLDLYRQCDEEYNAIMEIMDAHYVRATLGYGFKFWSKRQRKEILYQFQDIVDRRYKLRSDIHEYYMNKIEKRSEGSDHTIPSAASTESNEAKCQKIQTCTTALDTSWSCKNIVLNRKKWPKFTQILRKMKKRFSRNC